MNRVAVIRQLAEWRLQDAAREWLEAEALVDLPLTQHDDLPAIPDPPGWSGPCIHPGAAALGAEFSRW